MTSILREEFNKTAESQFQAIVFLLLLLNGFCNFTDFI